jgi:hypothetical protein
LIIYDQSAAMEVQFKRQSGHSFGKKSGLKKASSPKRVTAATVSLHRQCNSSVILLMNLYSF